MIAEIGHFALVLAVAMALVQTVVPFWGARTNDLMLMQVGGYAAGLQFAWLLVAFGALTWAYVTSDFSVANVLANSHSAKPLIYKITGVWGNHEGSMLLWVLILALFGFCAALWGNKLPPVLKADVLSVQGLVSLAFLLFVLFTSNPFERIDNPPLEGNDLNPLLQDIGLAIHPPLLYLGYVGFSMAFAFAIAALIEGRLDAAWARWVRPWTLAAWAFLTLGISMGSYWAYYELGWGGFWFWDSVENASFMPWLAGTALLHSAIVMEKREALKIWTVLLAILTFSLSLLGAFIVRSGVLTSVHTFATDPQRGLFLLMILFFFVGGSLALYLWRAPTLKAGGIFAPVSREGALVLNNVFLSAACATVLIGTLYPLVLETLTGQKITVGPAYFNSTFGPLALPLVLFVPFGPLLAWKRGQLYWAAQRLFVAMGFGLCVAVLVGVAMGGAVLPAVIVGLACYAMLGAFAELIERSKLGRVSLADSLRRLRQLPGAMWGSALGHLGVGVTLLGIIAATWWNIERMDVMQVGKSLEVGSRTIILQRLEPRQGPNYTDTVAVFSIRKSGVEVGRSETSKRFYTARQMTLTEAGLTSFGFSQMYVSLGEILDDGRSVAVRAEWKPLVLLIWIGSLFMAAGGVCSLFDRRLRIGAPKRGKTQNAG